MSLQFSANTVNAMLDAIEVNGSTAPIMTIRSGAVPANCSSANSGTVLATLTLPSDWMAAASGGSKAKAGTWNDTSADATGTAGHFRIHNSAGTECLMQGNTSATGGGGDLQLDNQSIATGQTVTITGFTITAGNYP